MATRKYEQRLRAENADLTRQRILTALQEQLQAAPSQPVSLDNIARAARVSRSTIYLVFGSRAGLFDALAECLWTQAGFGQLVEAVQDPDAREHLRRGIKAGVEIFAALRDIGRVLFSMAALDQDAIGGAIGRIEKDRASGMAHLAQRLADQNILRADVTAEQAADLLWLLTSFDGFDLLYTGRGLTPGQVADTLVTTAERALCR